MKTAKILIVDDDETIRKTLRRNLKRNGYEVREAENGEAALQLVAKERPEVVLLDVMMPGMSGVTVCQNLRSDPWNYVIYIIMLTGRAGGEVEGLKTGADDYITKPFEVDNLLARIEVGLRTVKDKRLAVGDPETGLYDKNFFQLLLDNEKSRAKRYGHLLSLILFSLDGFEKIASQEKNARHPILADVAGLISIRKSDVAARLENEFAMILPEIPASEAGLIAERLRKVIANKEFPEKVHFTASFGVSSMDYTAELLPFAEDSLLDAQDVGGNTVVVNGKPFQPKDDE